MERCGGRGRRHGTPLRAGWVRVSRGVNLQKPLADDPVLYGRSLVGNAVAWSLVRVVADDHLSRLWVRSIFLEIIHRASVGVPIGGFIGIYQKHPVAGGVIALVIWILVLVVFLPGIQAARE